MDRSSGCEHGIASMTPGFFWMGDVADNVGIYARFLNFSTLTSLVS